MKTTPIQPLDPWEAYPNIDLYMDQVLGVIDKQLSVYYRDPTDRVMTASMVNNYVKQQLLPPPVKEIPARTGHPPGYDRNFETSAEHRPNRQTAGSVVRGKQR